MNVENPSVYDIVLFSYVHISELVIWSVILCGCGMLIYQTLKDPRIEYVIFSLAYLSVVGITMKGVHFAEKKIKQKSKKA